MERSLRARFIELVNITWLALVSKAEIFLVSVYSIFNVHKSR